MQFAQLGGEEMQIRLENIGIVKDSVLSLDGLTVVTGKNNSGKSTVGKTLYALLDAVCNLQQKAKSDRKYYIRKQLETLESRLEVFRYMYIRDRRRVLGPAVFDNYPSLKIFLGKDYRRGFSVEDIDIEEFAHHLATELSTLDVEELKKSEAARELLYYQRDPFTKTDDDSASIASMLDTQRNSALMLLKQLFADLDKDMGLIDYARESINQTLQVEFSNQVQPVRVSVPHSKIELSDGDATFFNITLTDNNIVNDGTPVFFSSPYKKVYLVDDPFILDDVSSWRMYREFEMTETETIFNPNRIYSHNYKLKFAVRRENDLSVFEQTVLDDSLKLVKTQIDQIIPGTFEFSSNGEYYVQNGMKLKISNLATGSKMFSIIKILLEKGELNSSTMLILDEPEAHLHPQWQNSFAEIIVLLVKELDVNILLTTHSPNFMLALDANMRKYDVADKTNFYQTDVIDDCFVQYHCVNDDMGRIYQDFLQYLSEAKMLRNKYLH